MSLELTVMADEVIILPGPKIASWAKLFAARPDLLETYQQIALLDDDLLCSIDDLNASFAAGRAYNLLLWQPSLTWDSYFTYAVTLNNPSFTLRYVNFIELMCPFFAVDQLRRVLPLFSLGYEVYIDRMWCRLNENSSRRYAILDGVKLKHCRQIGSNAQAQGFSALNKTRHGGIYQSFIDQAEDELDIRFRGAVVYAGVTRKGKLVVGRLVMALMAFSVLQGWRKHKENKFIRPLLDHVRHILTRPIANEPIAINPPLRHIDGDVGVSEPR
jgi:hypothetical protein